MSDKDFVTFLLEETLKLQKSGEVELSSLEHKLKDYGLNYFKGEFVPQVKILRFITSFGKIDIPINWSVFSIKHSSVQFTLLDEKNDVDNFFKVIRTAWKQPLEKLLITHGEGFCYLIGLKSGEDAHLHDLINPQEWLKSA